MKAIRDTRIFIALALVSLAGMAWAGKPAMAGATVIASLSFTELAGADLSEHGTVRLVPEKKRLVVFWRADCPPCLREMETMPGIARQNPGMAIALISLHDTAHTRAHLPPMPANILLLVAQDPARQVLAAFGNTKTLALPYSVLLDGKGAVCRQRYGLIGPEIVKEWWNQC